MSLRDKKDSQLAHARRRALERFGVVLTEHDERELVRTIRAGKAGVVERQSHCITLHRVTLPGGEVAVAVYDSKRGVIVSFLHKEWKDVPL